MSVTIQRATLDRLDSFARIADPDIFDGPLDEERVARFVAAQGHVLLLATDGDAVVGQACAMVQHQLAGPDALMVDNLGVARTHRRMGIARRLWQELADFGRAEGCGAIWVPTEPACEAAVALYKALGLREGRAITFEAEL